MKDNPPPADMDRQAFLKLTAGSLFALPACGFATPDNADEHILIIGAGIAGLAAAHALRQKGFSRITVLESRHRVGGRIHSVHFGESILDAGASWIHGTKGNPLTDLVQQYELETTRTHINAGEIYLAEHDAVSREEWKVVERLLNRFYKTARKAPETSVAELLKTFTAQQNLSPRELQIFEAAVRSEIEMPYAADGTNLSSHALKIEDEMSGPQVTFPLGMSQLTDHLAEGLDIRFGAVVSRIQREGNSVRVMYHSDKQANSFNSCTGCHTPGQDRAFPEPESELVASRVLVTTPVSVLKSGNIKFTPALPVEKQEALKRVTMGTMNKVMLEFKDPFWPKTTFLQFAGNNRSNRIEFFNPSPDGNSNTLIAFACGAHAVRMEQLSDDDVEAEVMAALRGMFGRDATEPINMYRTVWHTDPYALGSYPHLAVGGRLSHMKTLAEPLDSSIFFAGDGTHPPYIGTAHGAYLSGIRAAREMANAIHSLS